MAPGLRRRRVALGAGQASLRCSAARRRLTSHFSRPLRPSRRALPTARGPRIALGAGQASLPRGATRPRPASHCSRRLRPSRRPVPTVRGPRRRGSASPSPPLSSATWARRSPPGGPRRRLRGVVRRLAARVGVRPSRPLARAGRAVARATRRKPPRRSRRHKAALRPGRRRYSSRPASLLRRHPLSSSSPRRGRPSRSGPRHAAATSVLRGTRARRRWSHILWHRVLRPSRERLRRRTPP